MKKIRIYMAIVMALSLYDISRAETRKILPKENARIQAEIALNSAVVVTNTVENGARGRVKYVYSVRNRLAKPIKSVWIGFDYSTSENEINVYPVGWSQARGLKPGTVVVPAGWIATVVTTEESDFAHIEFTSQGTASINKGRELRGLSIVVPTESAGYRRGHWTALLEDSTVETGLLVPR